MSELIAHDPVQTVVAGGIAPLGTKVPSQGDIAHATAQVRARSYVHPALAPGQLVVRLEPDAIAEGSDAEMAAFGFAAPTVSKPLGVVRARTLGFPAWALVNDPKKAKAALDVTDDLRKAKRMVAAKPGHAKDAFEKIAKQLQRTAPHFLPSFWEEAARVVADQASATMAAQCFERARQAERAFKLKTDPVDADAAFVEFALLGALSAKTLTAYAKDLTKTAGGAEAYRRYRAIVIKRAMGGMPPYSGMGKDLRALAAAAKLDLDREADAVFSELIEAPGVAKAPIEFWTTYRDSAVRLGQADRDKRNRLLAIWPVPPGGTDDARKAFAVSWMELLQQIGALDDVPEPGLGGWASKMILVGGKQPLVEQVLTRLAARLIAGHHKVAAHVAGRWGSSLSLDMAELILSLGIELAPPEERDHFARIYMTCDPIHVADHAAYGKLLVDEVADMVGDAEHEHMMRGKAGYAAARRKWLEGQLAKLAGGDPLLDIQETLTTLDNRTTPEFFLPYQDLHAKLVATDLAAALALQLRTGVAAEFCWPAFEGAVAKLGDQIRIGGAFPILTVWNATTAIAIDHTGVIAEHDLVYKAKEHELQAVWFFDGQFLVEFRLKSKWRVHAYWSSKPKTTFEFSSIDQWGGRLPVQWTLPDGSVTIGGKAFRAGDTKIEHHEFSSDGTSMWVRANDKFHLYDPVIGKRGPANAPSFASSWEKEGWRINIGLLPAPAGLTGSPIGLRDGLLGTRSRRKREWSADNMWEYERIDGVGWRGGRGVYALATFPGGDPAPRPIGTTDAHSTRFLGNDGIGVELYTTDGKLAAVCNRDAWSASGWGWVPPAYFWDYLTARDEAASAALRAITLDQARALLAAARGVSDPAAAPAVAAAIRNTLAISDDKLVHGIAAVIGFASELAERAASLAAARAKEHADPSGAGLLGNAAALRKLAIALAAGRSTKLRDFEFDPRDLLAGQRAYAVRCMLPNKDPEARRNAREMMQAISGTMFADDLSRIRTFSLEEPDDWDDPEDYNTLVIEPFEGSVFAIHAADNWGLELSTDDVFRVPPAAGKTTKGATRKWKLDDEVKLKKGVGTGWADRFRELADEPIAWDPAIGTKLAELTGLSVAEAILLWFDPSSLSRWERDFLGKQTRELVGLKTTEATAARTTFEEIDEAKFVALFERAAPEDPALLRTPLAPGAMVERLAAAWKAAYGKRAKVPQDLIAAAKKESFIARELGQLLPAFTGGADDVAFLKPDLRPLHELSGWSKEPRFDDTKADELTHLIGWLFLYRPVGCSVRAGIGDVIAKMTSIINEPRLIWPLDSRWLDSDDPKDQTKGQQIIDAVGGKPVAMPKDGDEECIDGRDDGAIVAARYKSQVYLGVRPSKLDAKTRKKAEQLGALTTDPDDGDYQGGATSKLRVIDRLMSDAFQAFGERTAETPVPEGGYEANPLQSVPKLVTKVAKELAVSEDAAALYLQTLALAEPTQQYVQLWNVGSRPTTKRSPASSSRRSS